MKKRTYRAIALALAGALAATPAAAIVGQTRASDRGGSLVMVLGRDATAPASVPAW